jgi:hypothetical protein
VNEMHPLGKLIQASQDRNGWSTRDLQRMAEQRGYNMTHSNFSRLKNEDVVSIKGSIIKLLSEVLGLPETKIARAAMASMGVDLQIDEVAVDEAVRNSDEFSERDRRIITSVLDAMRVTQSETNNEDQDKPETNPPSKPTLRAVGSRREVGQGQKINWQWAAPEADAIFRENQAYIAANLGVITGASLLEHAGAELLERVAAERPEDLDSVRAALTKALQFRIQQHHDELSEVPDRELLAAHPNFKLARDKFEEAYGERGEENQDPQE